MSTIRKYKLCLGTALAAFERYLEDYDSLGEARRKARAIEELTGQKIRIKKYESPKMAIRKQYL